MAEELQSFLKVLSAAVSCSQCPVTSSKFDVVAELTKEIQARLSSCSEEWAQSIQETDECSPSTSRGANDPRVRLGHVLTKIYEQLSRCLRKLKAGGRDEYTFLSVQEQAQVTATLEFYVLAQLLPYLDEGVGIPINKRSQYVKTWSRIDQDLEFRKIQILQFLSTIHVLIESNETLKLAAVRSVLSDVISAEEQLIQFGENGQDWINKLLNEVPKRELIAILMSLSKCYNRLKPSPLWFTTAIGARLSTVLRSSDGLYHFLGAYDEAGSGFWDNTHLLSKIAQQLALPPKSSKVMAYFEKIHKEFIAILKTKTYPERGMIQLYSSFADSMTAKQSLAGEVLVLDFLLKPFEILLDSSPDLISWSRAFTDAVWMLDLLSDDKIYPKVLANSSRLVQLIPFFLGLLTSDSFDYETVPTEIKSLSTKILKILSFILPKVENASELLFSFIVSTDSNCYQLVYKKTLITVVGDQNDSNLSIQRVPNSDREAVLMLKLDAVLKYIKELEKSAGSCLIIEILYESAKMWTSNSEQREEPRFVTLGSTIVESDWLRMASHLVALFCFEHLGEWEVDPTNSYMLTALSKLITIILDKAVEWLQARKEDDSFFDVSANLPEEESRIVKVQQMSIQLAVGLAAAVVAAGTVESASVLSEIPASLTRFVAVASADKELSEIVKDAQEVLQLLNMLGLKTDVQVQAAQVASRARPSVDFLEQLRLDLDDEMVPIRGEALLRVSKALRRRDPKALSVLEPWLYARVKELVADPDSYVFLSAINAMAEIALYDPKKYLNELLQLFSDLGHEKEQTDASLILRGNIAEVIGKVFRLLGDISPVWLDRAANIFLNALRENSDIIRASSLSAFSDLVAACRGRGLEKILNELFYAVETIIRTEKSELVRRAAIHLIRQCLRSCDKDLLSILGDRLRDLRRELTRLWKWDKDHVVRLHAELCLEEIGDGLKSALEDGHRQHLRVISMK